MKKWILPLLLLMILTACNNTERSGEPQASEEPAEPVQEEMGIFILSPIIPTAAVILQKVTINCIG